MAPRSMFLRGERGAKVLLFYRGVAQLGGALASGARGRRFKSSHPDHFLRKQYGFITKQTCSYLWSGK